MRGGQVLQGDDSNFGYFIKRGGFDFFASFSEEKKMVMLFHLKNFKYVSLVVRLITCVYVKNNEIQY